MTPNTNGCSDSPQYDPDRRNSSSITDPSRTAPTTRTTRNQHAETQGGGRGMAITPWLQLHPSVLGEGRTASGGTTRSTLSIHSSLGLTQNPLFQSPYTRSEYRSPSELTPAERKEQLIRILECAISVFEDDSFSNDDADEDDEEGNDGTGRSFPSHPPSCDFMPPHPDEPSNNRQ